MLKTIVGTTSKIIIVANTHLYFHPDSDHIRLLQIGFCMEYVQYVYEKVKKDLCTNDTNVSIIFCGDFNSVPECGIYKLMTQGFVEEDFIDFQSSKTFFFHFSLYFIFNQYVLVRDLCQDL